MSTAKRLLYRFKHTKPYAKVHIGKQQHMAQVGVSQVMQHYDQTVEFGGEGRMDYLFSTEDAAIAELVRKVGKSPGYQGKITEFPTLELDEEGKPVAPPAPDPSLAMVSVPVSAIEELKRKLKEAEDKIASGNVTETGKKGAKTTPSAKPAVSRVEEGSKTDAPASQPAAPAQSPAPAAAQAGNPTPVAGIKTKNDAIKHLRSLDCPVAEVRVLKTVVDIKAYALTKGITFPDMG